MGQLEPLRRGELELQSAADLRGCPLLEEMALTASGGRRALELGEVLDGTGHLAADRIAAVHTRRTEALVRIERPADGP